LLAAVLLLAPTFSGRVAGAEDALATWTLADGRLGTSTNVAWRLAYGNGRLVAVGGDATYASVPGGSWRKVFWGIASDVIYAAGTFVGVPGSGGPAQWSVDGETWRFYEEIQPESESAIAYGRGYFLSVACGLPNGIVACRLGADGKWQFEVLDWDALMGCTEALCYGKGRFVMSNVLLLRTSFDSTKWPVTFEAESAGFGFIWDVAYGNGTFVASGDDYTSDVAATNSAMLLTSSEAANWTRRGPVRGPHRGVAYAAGVFVGAGPDGTVYTSTDAVDWTPRKLDTSVAMEDVVFAAGRFVAIGRDGTVAYSDVVPQYVSTPRFRVRDCLRLPDGPMSLAVEAPYGREVVVEASEDMVNWREITRDPCDRGEFEVYDEAAKDLKQRYYRAWQSPPTRRASKKQFPISFSEA